MAANAVLFDLDGTIWDSYPWYAAAFPEICEVTAQDALSQLRAGCNIVHLVTESGVTKTRYRTSCLAVIDRLVLYQGFPDALDDLLERGVHLGVVTNLPKWLVEPALHDLGIFRYFGSIRYAAQKPSPTGIQRALAELGMATCSDVWYVGDRQTDAEAAHRAGLQFAWASYGYGSDDSLECDIRLQYGHEVATL